MLSGTIQQATITRATSAQTAPIAALHANVSPARVRVSFRSKYVPLFTRVSHMGWDRQRATTARYLLEGYAADLTARIRPSGLPKHQLTYVMHIEKTGGTSFRYALYDRFRQSEMFPNVYHEYLRKGRGFVLWDDVEAHPDRFITARTELIMGHFGLRPLELLNPPPLVATFLRDPISRMRSAIDFNRQPGRRYDGLSMDEVLSRHAWREGSMQAQAFGYNHDLDNIDGVIETFSRIDFVGFFENYERDMARFSDFLGLSDRLPVVRRNITGQRCELTASQLEKLHYFARPDQQLYDAARAMRQPSP